MAYLSLYRKYRPQTFEDLIGQSPVATTLANAVAEDRVAHAYLFTGPRGTGKTSTARILAKALNCEHGPTPTPCGVCASCKAIAAGSSLDLIEMDAASHSKVDETRDVLAGVALATAGGRKKVYVIDEVHMLSTPAFNALLKTLEEPPGHVVFILATTEAHKVLQTIQSRTQRFDFRPVPTDALETHLAHVAKLENIEIDPAAIALVARHAQGGVRDALSALDQLRSMGDHISVEDAERLLGGRWEDAFVQLFEAIGRSDLGAVFSTTQSLFTSGADARQLAIGVLNHARSLLLLKTAPDAETLVEGAPEDVATARAQSDRFEPSALLRVMDLVAKALTEMRNVPNHRLLLEIALVRAAAPETDPSATGLLGRIERLERRAGIEAAPADKSAVASVVDSLPAVAERPQADPPKPRRATTPPSREEPRREPAPSVPAASGDEPRSEPGRPPRVPAQVGFGDVRDAWPATLQEANKRSKRVWGLLNPSAPVRFDDDTLVVEVQSAFHVKAFMDERNRAIVSDALHAALGIRPRIDFLEKGQAAVANEAAGADLADYESARPVDPKDNDPVELLKKGLGAEVVEERQEGAK